MHILHRFSRFTQLPHFLERSIMTWLRPSLRELPNFIRRRVLHPPSRRLQTKKLQEHRCEEAGGVFSVTSVTQRFHQIHQKNNSKRTCIRIQMQPASLGGRTGWAQTPSDPYRGTPGVTKASQESLLKIYIYLWTRFLYLLRFNLSINCTNVTAVGHWTLSSGCQSRP